MAPKGLTAEHTWVLPKYMRLLDLDILALRQAMEQARGASSRSCRTAYRTASRRRGAVEADADLDPQWGSNHMGSNGGPPASAHADATFANPLHNYVPNGSAGADGGKRVYLSPATLVVVPVQLIPHWRQQVQVTN